MDLEEAFQLVGVCGGHQKRMVAVLILLQVMLRLASVMVSIPYKYVYKLEPKQVLGLLMHCVRLIIVYNVYDKVKSLSQISSLAQRVICMQMPLFQIKAAVSKFSGFRFYSEKVCKFFPHTYSLNLHQLNMHRYSAISSIPLYSC